MSKLSSELRLTLTLPYVVTCVMNSEFAVARRDMCLNIMLFFDHYYLREARFSDIDVIQNVGVIEKRGKK